MPYKAKPRPRRPRRRRTVRPRRMANLTKMVKAIQLKQCETKRSSQYTNQLQQIFHNRAYYAGNMLATTQGTSDPAGASNAGRNRVGDEVVAKGLSIRWFLENVGDHPNVIYKIYVFEYNTLESPLTDLYFWQGSDGFGANMNRTLDKPQTDRLKIRKVMTINPRLGSMNIGGQGGLVKTQMRQCWIPLNNRKIQYNADNSPNPRFRDIGFAILAYDAINTSETVVLTNMQWQSTFYYKDP